jgi:hypothetical protein
MVYTVAAIAFSLEEPRPHTQCCFAVDHEPTIVSPGIQGSESFEMRRGAENACIVMIQRQRQASVCDEQLENLRNENVVLYSTVPRYCELLEEFRKSELIHPTRGDRTNCDVMDEFCVL